MKAVFIGCVDFSVRVLDALLKSGTLVVSGVITRDRSSFNADFASLEPLASRCGIPVMTVTGNDQHDIRRWIEAVRPDVIFCVGWSFLLSPEILAIPRMGVIGYHPADLPKNRGRHPIIWALALGLEETASTFFRMTEGADAGPIVSKERVVIHDDDTAATLYERLATVAERQIVELGQRAATGILVGEDQQESLANVWRKRGASDGRIDWRMPSRGIYNLVRALTRPYPGATCGFRGTEVKVWAARPAHCNTPNFEPGKVLLSSEAGVVVKTGDGAIELSESEFPELPRVGEYL